MYVLMTEYWLVTMCQQSEEGMSDANGAVSTWLFLIESGRGRGQSIAVSQVVVQREHAGTMGKAKEVQVP